VKGEGTIPIQIPSGGIMMIKNFLYVPSLKNNLISISAIVDKNMEVKFARGSCTIIDCKYGRVVYKDIRDGGLYRLLACVVDHRALMHDDGTIMELWKNIFGHLNLDNLKKIQKMVRGIPQFNVRKISVCYACYMGKHHGDPFFTNDEKHARKPLYLVHSNVCGPMSTPSITGYLYFVTFIDDATRKCWTSFVKHCWGLV
jgi:hypothetical protein